MKQILIIGRNSYIGRWFQRHIETYAAKNMHTESIGASDGAWREADFDRYDCILHVAALVHKKEEPDMEAEYHRVNAIFPIEIAEKAKKCGVKKFVFLSTMAVYGEDVSMITKNTRENPKTFYGKSKLEAERQLRKLADETFQVIILRPPMVYGAGCPGNYKRLEKLGRIVPVIPKVKNQRSMIYIENLCECIKRVVEEENESYKVICPQNVDYVNTSEFIRSIRSAIAKKTCVLPIGHRIITLLAKSNPTLHKVFGDCCYEKNPADANYQVADFKESVQKTVKL